METKSPKEQKIEGVLLSLVDDLVSRYADSDPLPHSIAYQLIHDPEVETIQDYANNVSITRMGLNDHGPVHMKIVCCNALRILGLLRGAGVQTSLEREGAGTFVDSISGVIIAALLHDCGMTISRKGHELYSGIIAYSLINDLVRRVLPGEENTMRRTVIRSIAMEGILGHMATRPIHSIEAGIILVADGCDMTKGRARIPLELTSKPAEGDIHKYSANSIEKVHLYPGSDQPVKIEITMRSEVGFFQVEEVLIPKLQSSPIKPYIELYAGVEGEELKRYL